MLLIRRIVFILILLVAAVWAGDLLSLRLRIPRRDPLGTVQVRRYYAVALKNHKTEYMFDSSQNVTCVNSLFPHDGNTPCWYLVRHRHQNIEVNSGPPPLF